jgi:hypothetical protein
MFGNHTRDTRQPAIIRLLAELGCFLVLSAPAGAFGQREPAGPAVACVSCVIVRISASEAAGLSGPAGLLSGLTVIVDAADPLAAAALERLRGAGATVGVVVAPGEAPSADVLPLASVLVVRAVTGTNADIFALRTLATAARVARRDVRVLVEGVPPERARAYVDGSVASGPHLSAPSAEALVAASTAAGGEPILLHVANVEWAAVAGFAGKRAHGTEVVAAAPLTAAQIVARHQAQRRSQEGRVTRTIARGSTTLLFEVPGFASPVTVTARTVIYRRPGVTEMEQREIRVNGAAVTGGGASSPPRLPLIEPERVAAPPLVITLGDEYRYSLAGRGVIGEAAVFVVTFEPRDEAAGLARGRAWIDTASFALRRLETVQTGLRGAIVSSEQHEEFGPFAIGDENVWLPVRTRVYQMYEGAGHRTPVHRTIDTPEYSIDPDDFDSQVRAAYASPHVMLRETPQGFRYLLRDPDARDGANREVAPRAGERIRTAVFGVLVDPGITVPLPFAGFSYVDLNVFDTGAQLNAFFGGTYGQLSWSVPSLGGTRWQAHGRAFAIAARYNDRSFRDGIEQYDENLTQRPAHVSAGVMRPLSPRFRVRLGYELDYTALDRADSTRATFVVPPDPVVHGFVAALETESGPWTAKAWWNPARRHRWLDVETRAFQRFGVGIARTLALGRIASSRVEAAWADGTDLDRFSRYGFGAFENRLSGYPTATIRYDRGAVLRTVTSWVGRGFRVDTFADVAAVQDPGFGGRDRLYPGVGAAVEVGGPARTLWSIEWGHGFRARRSDGGLGTHAVRITGFRVF